MMKALLLTCHSVTHKRERWIWFPLSYAMKTLLRLAAVRDTKQAGELRGDTVHFIASSSALVLNGAKRQHLSTINTNSDLSFTNIQQQTYRRKQLMDQADDNSLTALLTKRDQVRFREVANTCTERRAERRIQRTVWILSHALRKTLCEHVNGLCPAGWLNEQSITKHWFRSVRTCPYGWATGRNTRNMKFNRCFFKSLHWVMLAFWQIDMCKDWKKISSVLHQVRVIFKTFISDLSLAATNVR